MGRRPDTRPGHVNTSDRDAKGLAVPAGNGELIDEPQAESSGIEDRARTLVPLQSIFGGPELVQILVPVTTANTMAKWNGPRWHTRRGKAGSRHCTYRGGLHNGRSAAEMTVAEGGPPPAPLPRPHAVELDTPGDSHEEPRRPAYGWARQIEGTSSRRSATTNPNQGDSQSSDRGSYVRVQATAGWVGSHGSPSGATSAATYEITSSAR